MASNFFNELNKEQARAVSQTEGPSIVLAGAGSGKTRVLISKVLHLIEGKKVPSSRILMITFTNKAASEMKNRIEKNLGEGGKIGYVGTFHSFCARVLRIDGEALGLSRDFSIFDTDDQISLIKKAFRDYEIKKFTPSYYLHRISAAKNELISHKKYLEIFSDFAAAETAKIYSAYQKELFKNNAVDFDDLILKTIELFTTREEYLEKYQDKYKYILVDEFQDTNLAQYFLTRLLAKKYQNITIVGDFSQSIYSWRGADIKNLEKFQKDFPGTKTFYLERNYRSTSPILNFAYKIISKNKSHPILELYTDETQGEEIVFYEAGNEQEEAIYIAEEIERLNKTYPYSSFAVLYRTNAQSRVIEEGLLHYGIPYVLIGGTRFYERREVKDVLAYLRLFINPQDSVARERTMKLGKRRWAQFEALLQKEAETAKEKTTSELIEMIFSETDYLKQYNPDDQEDFARLENIKELKSVAMSFPNIVEFLEQVALVESEYSEGEKKHDKERVRMMTLHAAKGLEFDCVFIVGVEEGLLPHSRSINDQLEIEEERRLFYVGITRAKNKLHITNARRRFIFGRRGEAVKSRFLLEEETDFEYNRF